MQNLGSHYVSPRDQERHRNAINELAAERRKAERLAALKAAGRRHDGSTPLDRFWCAEGAIDQWDTTREADRAYLLYLESGIDPRD